MSSLQSTMRTCTRGASGAGVSVPAARGIPNSRAPSCHLERACRLRLAAGTRAAPQRTWRSLDVERECHRRLAWGRHVPESIGARLGPLLGPSQPRWTALRHVLPGPEPSGWMVQIRGEGCEVLMSCEFRRSVHSYSCVLGLVLTSFHLLLSYATWLCVFGFLCLRFGFWIFHCTLFIYLFCLRKNPVVWERERFLLTCG